MQTAAIVFALAALGGITLAALRLRGAPRPPTWIALGHGVIAIAGIALLSYAAYSPGIPGMAQLALVLFVLAATGGLAMFAGFHLQNRPLPIPLMLGHGLLALTGLTLLILAIL